MFRAINFQRYLNSMKQRGFLPEEVLEGTHLAAEQLNNSDQLINLWQYNRVIANMIKLTGNQALAFELTNEAEITDLGIVGYAMLSSRCARDAMKLWITYSRSLVGMLVQMQMNEYDNHWQISFSAEVPAGDALLFCTEELLLFNLLLGEKLIGKQLKNKSLELAYPTLPHSSLYESYFKCPVIFDAPQTRLTVFEPNLNIAVKSNNEELHTLCLDHCDKILHQMTQTSSMGTRIRSLLLETPGHPPDLQEIAEKLHYSTRTLKRHLKQQGLSYKTLVNEFRSALAQEYLLNSHMSTKEVAYYLGYSDVSAFRRAFKSWNGLTISEFLTKNSK